MNDGAVVLPEFRDAAFEEAAPRVFGRGTSAVLHCELREAKGYGRPL